MFFRYLNKYISLFGAYISGDNESTNKETTRGHVNLIYLI